MMKLTKKQVWNLMPLETRRELIRENGIIPKGARVVEDNNVICDGTNNNTASNVLTVDITIYPKSTFIPGASTNIGGFNITVTASE